MKLKTAVLLSLIFALAVAGFMTSNASNEDKPVQIEDPVNGTVSIKVTGPPKEWTLEEMLLATPMPMTQEERDFLHTHPSLDGIRKWSNAEFEKYISSPLGQKHLAEEAWRWRDLAGMLNHQVAAASRILGKPALPAAAVAPTKKGEVDLQQASIEQFQAALSTPQKKDVFEQMKKWRQQIADLAPQMESMRKEAQGRGISDSFEEQIGDIDH